MAPRVQKGDSNKEAANTATKNQKTFEFSENSTIGLKSRCSINFTGLFSRASGKKSETEDVNANIAKLKQKALGAGRYSLRSHENKKDDIIALGNLAVFFKSPGAKDEKAANTEKEEVQREVVEFLDKNFSRNPKGKLRKWTAHELGFIGKNAASEEMQTGIVKKLNADNSWLNDRTSQVRMESIESLQCIGEKAKSEALQNEIIDILTMPEKGINDKGVDYKDFEKTIRRNKEVVGHPYYDGNNKNVRGTAYIALGKVGAKAKNEQLQNKIIDSLTGDSVGINDKFDDVATHAFDALKLIGENAKSEEVQNRIIGLLNANNNGINSQSEMVRRYSYEYLGKVGGENAFNVGVQETIVSMLVETGKGINNPSLEVKVNAYLALGKIAANAKSDELRNNIMDNELDKGLNDENPRIREAVYRAFGDIALKNKKQSEIANKLTDTDNHKGIHDPNDMARSAAYETIGIIAGSTKDKELLNNIVDKLIKPDQGIKDRYEHARMGACKALGKAGLNAEGATLPDVIVDKLTKPGQGINDEDKYVRKYACETLGYTAAKAEDTVLPNVVVDKLTELGQGISDKDPEVKQYACMAMCFIGKNINDEKLQTKIVDELTNPKQGIRAEDKQVRENTCIYLGSMAAESKCDKVVNRVVNELIKANQGINDKDEKVKNSAISTLKSIALRKGNLNTGEILKHSKKGNVIKDKDGNAVPKTIFTKVLHIMKDIQSTTSKKSFIHECAERAEEDLMVKDMMLKIFHKNAKVATAESSQSGPSIGAEALPTEVDKKIIHHKAMYGLD